VSPVDEELYSELMAPRRNLWKSRAATAKGETRVVYALRRADALSRPYVRKLARCSKRGVRVKCGCKGWRGVRAYTCRQHMLCETCQVARARRLGRRIREGLEAAFASRPHEKLVLLTLTVRHSGSVDEDRDALARGWRAFYKRLNAAYGRFPYVGVWEVTPGTDGTGHVHAHVAVIWPWRDWGECREMWLQSCPESERITFVARRRDGLDSSPRSVAKYLSKYLSKGLQTAEFSPELRTRVVAMMYGQRSVFTSRRFWQAFVPLCCACQCPVVVAQYRWSADRSAGADDRDGPRGPPQLALALPEPEQRGGLGSARWRNDSGRSSH